MIVGIVLSGSLWVMYHMNHNMMPHLMQDPHDVMPISTGATGTTNTP
jgi:cytochrome o ubiquinol oxidase operon protein cyoD